MIKNTIALEFNTNKYIHIGENVVFQIRGRKTNRYKAQTVTGVPSERKLFIFHPLKQSIY